MLYGSGSASSITLGAGTCQDSVPFFKLQLLMRNKFSLFFRSVNLAETRIKLLSGQPALAQFYNTSPMVEIHRHHFSELQLRARPSYHLNTTITIVFQRCVFVSLGLIRPCLSHDKLLYSEVVNHTKYISRETFSWFWLTLAPAVHLLKIDSNVCESSMLTRFKVRILTSAIAVSSVLSSCLSPSSMGVSSPSAQEGEKI